MVIKDPQPEERRENQKYEDIIRMMILEVMLALEEFEEDECDCVICSLAREVGLNDEYLHVL